MTAPFDPYHRWLGIPSAEQPADHYRLLGLARFEDDIEVIRDAAERQMGHVRRYAGGDHADDAKRILNELGGAKGCLTTRSTRPSGRPYVVRSWSNSLTASRLHSRLAELQRLFRSR